MDFSHYSDSSVQMAIDLVNTENPASGADRLTTVADLSEFLNSYQADWHTADWTPAPPTRSDLDEVRDLRSRLRRVFEAGDETTAADRLNEMLAGVAATPRISVHTDSPHLHFEPLAGDTAAWLGATTAMGLSVALIDGGLERLGICSSSTCDDVFVDASKNRSRKHCSTTCTTRENVAAHRRRTRAADKGD